jgi:Ca2+-binding EF-hand superfamily protein
LSVSFRNLIIVLFKLYVAFSAFSITKSQYLLQGKSLNDDEINNKVKSCFSECDLNCDGRITEDEFYKAGKSVAEMFELEGDD